ATKNIPVLREITFAATNVLLGIPSGLIAGTGELLGGISTLIGHPVQTVNGIGALFGQNPDISAGTAWSELGKALIAYDEFGEGNIGKGVGKVALNVLLTVTGASAATAGAKAGAIALRVAKAAGANTVKASLKAAATGTNVAVRSFGAGAVRAPGNIIRGVGKGIGAIVKSPVTIGRYIRMGKLARVEASIAKYSDEVAVLSQKGSELLTKSGLPKELAGMSVDELAILAKDGSRLGAMGIDNAKNISSFLRFQAITKNMARATTALNTAEKARIVASQAAEHAKRSAKMADEMAEALPKIQSKLDDAIVNAEKKLEQAKKTEDAKGIIKATKKLNNAKKYKITTQKVLDGKVTLEAYAEIRGLKSLSIREQQFLAQKILENSGKTIDDLIRMDDTLGIAQKLSPKSSVELGSASVKSLSKTRGAETLVEGIQSGSLNYKSLTQLDDALRSLPACPETTMLTELSDDL
ncbi:MAG: hypothetical protein QF815_02525, partial [Candidatus Peribacteraceae bacterium]|nr:hypothetical protein [Candidatus Peribacteraceae bacterium]